MPEGTGNDAQRRLRFPEPPSRSVLSGLDTLSWIKIRAGDSLKQEQNAGRLWSCQVQTGTRIG
jgi:hypothetical protein